MKIHGILLFQAKFYENLNMASTESLPKRLIYVAVSAIIIGFITISCLTILMTEAKTPVSM